MNKIFTIALLLCSISVLKAQVIPSSRSQIASEMEHSLTTELLDRYYPLNTDTVYGGFMTTYTYDIKPTGTQDKFLVTQARHTWTTSRASALYPEKAYYRSAAKSGFLFLKNFMWDKEYGGFYNLVDRTGKPKPDPIAPKEAYGNAFAIYALSAYYEISEDTLALELAKKAFDWLEQHSHDSLYKGYYQHLKRDGSPVPRTKSTPTTAETGYKDQNSSIHLLEAFTELYHVWPDPLVRERLTEMLMLIRDKITTERGTMTLFFTPDWNPVSYRDSSANVIMEHKYLDHVSAGHDVETAYLLLEASHALGLKNDSVTLRVAKRMVDHSLKNVWDNKVGGFFDQAYYFSDKPGITITMNSKKWWAQAEGLNTLLLMADLFPDDSLQYYNKFVRLWDYSKTYLIDHVYGDWYEEGLDNSPDRKTALKAHIWKATYHNFRSLSNCISRLKERGTE